MHAKASKASARTKTLYGRLRSNSANYVHTWKMALLSNKLSFCHLSCISRISRFFLGLSFLFVSESHEVGSQRGLAPPDQLPPLPPFTARVSERLDRGRATQQQATSDLVLLCSVLRFLLLLEAAAPSSGLWTGRSGNNLVLFHFSNCQSLRHTRKAPNSSCIPRLLGQFTLLDESAPLCNQDIESIEFQGDAAQANISTCVWAKEHEGGAPVRGEPVTFLAKSAALGGND
ncbi:hypothetical protein B0T21DRAFT_117217 [Apiosordaria backusii]|uniref:Uncharacterized protein n=1 Tax=Apiosordaria backusii TaxID=314023 RepID=A0AA40ELS6_9PEZI|nr:hypothetical protein B0T21DRAFT_117217 [Apiosordaria backusii]